jgi:hypothetical protein
MLGLIVYVNYVINLKEPDEVLKVSNNPGHEFPLALASFEISVQGLNKFRKGKFKGALK